MALTLLVAQPLLAAELEGLDDEFDIPAAPQHTTTEQVAEGSRDAAEAASQQQTTFEQAKQETEAKPTRALGKPAFKKRDNYYFECILIAFFGCYVVIAFFGSRNNKKVAEAWAQAYAAPGTLLDKNFSMIGDGEESTSGLLMQEGANTFKLYASGRRFCEGLLATVNLKPRQDLLSSLFGFLFSFEDTVDIQVYMHESNMPQMVLAVGTPKQLKTLQERADVKRYTKALKVTNEHLVGKWNSAKLHVAAEHSSMFYDLFSDAKLAQVFSHPSLADQMRHFRYLLVTSENSEGSHKRLLQLQFALPAKDDMKGVAALMGLVPHLIDLVGTYKLSVEQKKRAVDSRAKSDSQVTEEKRRERLEALQQRKMEKLMAEKERLKRLPPDQRARAEEKLMRQHMKKQQKTKVTRM